MSIFKSTLQSVDADLRAILARIERADREATTRQREEWRRLQRNYRAKRRANQKT